MSGRLARVFQRWNEVYGFKYHLNPNRLQGDQVEPWKTVSCPAPSVIHFDKTLSLPATARRDSEIPI